MSNNNIREIQASEITKAVAELCIKSNYELPEDTLAAIKKARDEEESPQGRQVLDQLIENADVALKERIPLCQDCGAAVVYLELGQNAHIVGGNLYEAVAEGVKQGYTKGYLRKSMVKQPFSTRINTKDNTPPIIHTEIVPGNQLKISVLPKGGGAENMSRLYMLNPGAGKKGIIDAVVKTVDEAGGNPCPPVVVGLGIGGTAEAAMEMAKKSFLRPVGQPSPDPELAALEKEALAKLNNLGIGPMGIGGRITALAVHAEAMAGHIASLPVAVNLQCHSCRHKTAVL